MVISVKEGVSTALAKKQVQAGAYIEKKQKNLTCQCFKMKKIVNK